MKLIPTIYILEDEETFILRFKLILQKIGISTQEFRPFKSVEALRAEIEQKLPDVLFIDLMLKNLEETGFKILKELKQKYNGHLIIGIISNSDDIEHIKKASDIGAKFYIVKNGSIDKFQDRLKSFNEDFIKTTNLPKTFKIYN